MTAGPMDEHHNPDPNSKTQRKLALVRAARQYAKQYTWRTKKDPLHSDAEHRRATRNLLRAASSLPRSQHRRTIGTEHGKLKPAISHLLGAAHGYRTNPSKETRERLLAVAVTGTTPKTCPRNGAATRKIRKSERVRPRPKMTAQDIAEALDDVEALLGKLERIMSD